VRAPALDEGLEVDEREDDGLEEPNATGRLTLAEIAQAALDAELEENDFDWQPVWKMREPAPEPSEPAPPQPSEPAPEPEQPEPAPQSAPMEPAYFPLQPELAADASRGQGVRTPFRPPDSSLLPTRIDADDGQESVIPDVIFGFLLGV
jgi:hypothetical protein